MRTQAQTTTSPEAGIQYLDGTAESIPFGDGTAALIMAAQAAHWFDQLRFAREASRVLTESGIVALLFNSRVWQNSAFLDEHERLLERLSPGYTRTYREIDFLAAAAATGLFLHGRRDEFLWEAALTLDQWLGFCRSTTYVRRAAEAHGQEMVEAQIIAIADRHLRAEGTLSVPYRTDLFAFQRQ
jgi:SAM-dependent methyltransferase